MNNNTTYQQLMLLPSDELTEPQKTFLSVHNEMVMAGQKAAECLLIIANDMRRMRDEKLYQAAGFETFKDYVETALNIKERQAYNWISVLELPEAYLTKNAGMGVTKLALIASASEKVAADLMEDETTTEKSVRELQAIIKEKDAELEDKTKQIRFLTEKLEEVPTTTEAPEVDTSAFEEEIDALKGKLKDAKEKLETASDKLAKEKAKVKELKDLSDAEAAAEKARAEKIEAEEKAKKAEAELTAYKKTQEAVATFKVHAANLFDMWDSIVDAVKQIKAADPEYAAKCVAKLITFNDTVKSDLEGVQQ